jgi:transcriptional regulator with XRE-family HTH domain
MNNLEIGSFIRGRRQTLRLKQSDLSEMAGVNLRTVIQIEKGKVNPSLDTLQKIAEVLGLTLFLEVKSELAVKSQLVKNVMDEVKENRKNKL